MTIVQMEKGHCGLRKDRILTMTAQAAKKLEAKRILKIIDQNPTQEKIAMVERQGRDVDDESPSTKATDKAPRNKAVQSKDTRRKAPTNVTTSADLDEGPDGESDD